MSFTNKLIFFLLFLVFCPTIVRAQHVETEYYLPLHTFIDNREYFNTVHPPQTIFGARFSPEAGFLLDSAHRFRVGVTGLREFGAEQGIYQFDWILYYQYLNKSVDFYMGVFPRMGLLDDYPLPLLNDTLRYFRPMVEGIYLNLKHKRGFQKVWIDWTSRQTDVNRETFLTGFSGRYFINNRFFFDNYFVLYHYAGSGVPQPDDHIRDNLGLFIKAGLDISQKQFFDSLTLSVSLLSSFDRLRNVYDWQTPLGIQYGLYAKHKNIFVNTVFYSGDKQSILYGDSFYKAPVYGRADFGYDFFNKDWIKLRFVFSLHYIEEHLDNQQLLNVVVSTGKIRKP